ASPQPMSRIRAPSGSRARRSSRVTLAPETGAAMGWSRCARWVMTWRSMAPIFRTSPPVRQVRGTRGVSVGFAGDEGGAVGRGGPVLDGSEAGVVEEAGGLGRGPAFSVRGVHEQDGVLRRRQRAGLGGVDVDIVVDDEAARGQRPVRGGEK